jgi:hypothetical protein
LIKSILLVPVILLSLVGSAQQLSQVLISGGATLSAFSIITNQKVVIRISSEGKLIEWGTDPGIGRYNYYTGQLQPYLGRVEYYNASEYDSVLRGKIKAIGTCTLTYTHLRKTKQRRENLNRLAPCSWIITWILRTGTIRAN